MSPSLHIQSRTSIPLPAASSMGAENFTLRGSKTSINHMEGCYPAPPRLGAMEWGVLTDRPGSAGALVSYNFACIINLHSREPLRCSLDLGEGKWGGEDVQSDKRYGCKSLLRILLLFT
jgi:hypothetical protein